VTNLSYVPNALSAVRKKVLETGLAQEGVREATGKNDGDVLKFVPAWARGKGLPYCAWFAGWCFIEAIGEHPYGRHLGAVWDLYQAAMAKDEALALGAPWPALGPQPGDIFIIFHGKDYLKRPTAGHTGLVLRVNAEGDRINTLEGNFRNKIGCATRAVSGLAAIINPYGRIADELEGGRWERGLIDLPLVGGLANTR
jgi:hypothetical protein